MMGQSVKWSILFFFLVICVKCTLKRIEALGSPMCKPFVFVF